MTNDNYNLTEDSSNEILKEGIYYLVTQPMENWRQRNIQDMINGHIESLRNNPNLPSIVLY